MATFLIYLAKSALCLILFYLAYKTLLGNETFFRFNRFTLLIGTIVCLTIPAIHIPTTKMNIIQQRITEWEQIITSDKVETASTEAYGLRSNAQSPVSHSVKATQANTRLFQPLFYPALLYLAGVTVTALLLLVSFGKLIRLITSGEKIGKSPHCIIRCKKEIQPFSWGKYILLPSCHNTDEQRIIILHEKIHIRSLHSIDILLFQAIIILQWFNPAAWLLLSELKKVHEYEADQGVIKQGINATQYQLLLVKKAVGARLYSIANSFNHSKIKNRITMMLKRKSNRWARLKILFLVPVSGLAIHAFAQPEIKSHKVIQNSITTKDQQSESDEKGEKRQGQTPEKTILYTVTAYGNKTKTKERSAQNNEAALSTKGNEKKDSAQNRVAPPPPPSVKVSIKQTGKDTARNRAASPPLIKSTIKETVTYGSAKKQMTPPPPPPIDSIISTKAKAANGSAQKQTAPPPPPVIKSDVKSTKTKRTGDSAKQTTSASSKITFILSK